MRCPLALYRNTGDFPIDLRIGEWPGEPPFIYAAGPGKTVEGPANYERTFVAAGYVLEKHLGDGEVTAPQAPRGNHAAATVAAVKVPEVAPAPAAPVVEEPPAGVVIGAAPPPPTEEPPPKKKGRGG